MQRLAYFRVTHWSDSTDYEAWVRGANSSQGELWKLSCKRPTFPFSGIDGKEIEGKLVLSPDGKPLAFETVHGTLEVRSAEKKESVTPRAGRPIGRSPEVPSFPPGFTLEPDEKVWWSGIPGLRGFLVVISFLTALVAGVFLFGRQWVQLFGLCWYRTPSAFQIPCFAIVGLGLVFLGFLIVKALKMIHRIVRYKPIYLVTDRRALVISHHEPIVEYRPWELAYAEIKRRKSEGDIIFPTQKLPRGNFFSVKELAELERALSYLLTADKK